MPFKSQRIWDIDHIEFFHLRNCANGRFERDRDNANSNPECRL